MKKTLLGVLIIIMITALYLAAVNVFHLKPVELIVKGEIPKVENGMKNKGDIAIANPASAFCEEQGGTVEISTDREGNQLGYCTKDGKKCEEWQYYRNECIFETATPDDFEIFDFNQTGNIVNTDPVKSSVGPDFSLLYEKPGAPAMKADLIFDDKSQCDYGTGITDCLSVRFNIGDRVTVKGVMENSRVRVVELVKDR